MTSLDEELARTLSGLCDDCERVPAVEGYDLCTSCYEKVRSRRRVIPCRVCSTPMMLGTSCIVCTMQQAPSENASYDELVAWEAIRNKPDDEEMAIRLSIIDTLPTRDKTEADNTCSICLEDYDTTSTLMTLPCMHTFHADCCKKWLQEKLSCPQCQKEVGV